MPFSVDYLVGFQPLTNFRRDSGIIFWSRNEIIYWVNGYVIKLNLEDRNQTILNLSDYLEEVQIMKREDDILILLGILNESLNIVVVDLLTFQIRCNIMLSIESNNNIFLDGSYDKKSQELAVIVKHEESLSFLISSTTDSSIKDKETILSDWAAVHYENGHCHLFTTDEHLIFHLDKDTIEKESASSIEWPSSTSRIRAVYSSYEKSMSSFIITTDEIIMVYDFDSKSTQFWMKESLPEAFGKLLACFAVSDSSVMIAFHSPFSLKFYSISSSNSFQMIKDIGVQKISDVTGISISAERENLVVQTLTRDIASLSINGNSITVNQLNLSIIPFGHKCNSVSISSIRPLMLLSCSDKSVKIYDYEAQLTKWRHVFPDEVYCSAIDTSGLLLLVGFVDKVKLFSLNSNDPKVFSEWPLRGAKQIKFSNGGHLFAVVMGNVIVVVNTHRLKVIATFKGHHAKINDISFSKDDSQLISAGSDGAIYVWNLLHLKREEEHVMKRCQYYSACSTGGVTSTLYAIGSDKYLRQVEESQVVKEIHSDIGCTKLCLSRNQLYLAAGTIEGKVKIFRLPLEDNVAHQIRCLSTPVFDMKFSSDSNSLFVWGEEGNFCVISLSKVDSNRSKYSDDILVSRTVLTEQVELTRELNSQIMEIRMANDYQLRIIDSPHQERKKEAAIKYSTEISQLELAEKSLVKAKEDHTKKYFLDMTELRERDQKKYEKVENSYREKLVKMYENIQILQQKLAREVDHFKQEYTKKKLENEETVKQKSLDHEAKLRLFQQELESMKEELKIQSKEIKETLRQQEIDADEEILNFASQFVKRFQLATEDSLRVKGENGIMRKKFNSFQKDIEDFRSEIQRLNSEHEKLRQLITNMEKEATTLKKEIQERDDFIHDKEKRVFELKRNNQELEKFKYVLEHKIKELRKQIEPKEADLADMKRHAEILGKELEDYFVRNSKLEESIGAITAKIEVLRKDKESEKLKAERAKKKVDVNARKIQTLIEYLQEDFSVLTEEFLKLVTKKPADEVKKESLEINNALVEWEYQKKILEDKIEQIKKFTTKTSYISVRDESYRISENEKLVTELNTIRKEIYRHQMK